VFDRRVAIDRMSDDDIARALGRGNVRKVTRQFEISASSSANDRQLQA
jgi:hypothetical protein